MKVVSPRGLGRCCSLVVALLKRRGVADAEERVKQMRQETRVLETSIQRQFATEN
jgi:protein-tyrosine phosphatase